MTGTNPIIDADSLDFHERIVRFVREELRPIERQVETSGVIPETIVERMRQLGLFGMSIPKAYGGLGLSTLAEIRIYEELTNRFGPESVVFDFDTVPLGILRACTLGKRRGTKREERVTVNAKRKTEISLWNKLNPILIIFC